MSIKTEQGGREGGRGGNFYRGPDRKRGPERVNFTTFWVIFQNFTGAPDKIHHSLYGPETEKPKTTNNKLFCSRSHSGI
jgi:hypothetical protein